MEARNLSYQLVDVECMLGQERQLVLTGLPASPMRIEQVFINSMGDGFYELDDIIIDDKRVEMLSTGPSEESIFLELEEGHYIDPYSIHQQCRHPWIWHGGEQGIDVGPHSGRTTVIMKYTGLVPPGHRGGETFKATVLFRGAAVSDGH